MTDFVRMTYVMLKHIEHVKSSVIDLETCGKSYGDKGQAGNGQPERLNPRTSAKEDVIVQTGFERFGGGNNKTSRHNRGHQSNRRNEQVTLQNQDPVKKFIAGLKPSLIDLETYGKSYGNKAEGVSHRERLNEKGSILTRACESLISIRKIERDLRRGNPALCRLDALSHRSNSVFERMRRTFGRFTPWQTEDQLTRDMLAATAGFINCGGGVNGKRLLPLKNLW